MPTEDTLKDIEGGIRYALLPDQLQRLPAMWSVTQRIISATNNLNETDLAAWWHNFVNEAP